MTCEELEGLLADFLGAELEDSDRRRVDAHLAECAQCRREVRELQASLAALAESPDVGFEDAARRTAGLEVRRREPRARRLARVLVPAAAVLLLGLALGWRLGAAQSSHLRAPGETARAHQRGIHPGWVAAAARAFGDRAQAPIPERR